MFCLDPGYILRPGYRGHWSLVDITYYLILCNITKQCNIFCTLYTHYFYSVADLPGVHIWERKRAWTYTGTTKVALVELPTVNMFGFFFCTPFPLRILAWSFVVPWSNFHPPKAFNLIDLKAGDNWPSHTCHTKWAWKCDPRLTEMDALSSCQEA